jgi:hypothetical protein
VSEVMRVGKNIKDLTDVAMTTFSDNVDAYCHEHETEHPGLLPPGSPGLLPQRPSLLPPGSAGAPP